MRHLQHLIRAFAALRHQQMTDAGAHHLVALAFHQRRGGHTALQLQKQLLEQRVAEVVLLR